MDGLIIFSALFVVAIIVVAIYRHVINGSEEQEYIEERKNELDSYEREIGSILSAAERYYNGEQTLYSTRFNRSFFRERIDAFAKWAQEILQIKSELINKECELKELSEAIHREADQYAEQVKIEADQYAKQIKLEADRYAALIKQNTEKNAKEYIDSYLSLQREKEDFKIISEEKTAELVKLQSNLTALPYCAGIRADFETHGIELLAESLDWGQSQERAKKVASIRQIRAEAKEIAQRHIQAKYQLEYLLTMFPALEEVLDTEYGELPSLDISNISDYDKTRDWLSKEEYNQLNTTERNQLALDRYRESSRKSKWQIGRDYELFIGYELTRSGYIVDYFGSYMGLEDLGRDLIAKRNDKTLIVQCKYWSAQKQIHEKHVLQLYGTLVCYCMEHYIDINKAEGMLVTNITLSETAKRMAKYLKIKYKENYALGNYPCIKCNIGKNENGEKAFIYHLPFDQQYDHTKIDSPGEFFAMTVAEAENAGFRRALKWFGTGS